MFRNKQLVASIIPFHSHCKSFLWSSCFKVFFHPSLPASIPQSSETQTQSGICSAVFKRTSLFWQIAFRLCFKVTFFQCVLCAALLKLSGAEESPGELKTLNLDSVWLGWGLWVYISINFPGAVEAARPRTSTLRNTSHGWRVLQWNGPLIFQTYSHFTTLCDLAQVLSCIDNDLPAISVYWNPILQGQIQMPSPPGLLSWSIHSFESYFA